LFEEQTEAYRESVLPTSIPALSVEAAASFGWARYADASVSIDRFGASAPGQLVLDKLGMNVDNVVAKARVLLSNG
jgi:transketolase